MFSDGAASRLGCVSVVAGGGDGFGMEEPGDAGGLCDYAWGGAGAAYAQEARLGWEVLMSGANWTMLWMMFHLIPWAQNVEKS